MLPRASILTETDHLYDERTQHNFHLKRMKLHLIWRSIRQTLIYGTFWTIMFKSALIRGSEASNLFFPQNCHFTPGKPETKTSHQISSVHTKSQEIETLQTLWNYLFPSIGILLHPTSQKSPCKVEVRYSSFFHLFISQCEHTKTFYSNHLTMQQHTGWEEAFNWEEAVVLKGVKCYIWNPRSNWTINHIEKTYLFKKDFWEKQTGGWVDEGMVCVRGVALVEGSGHCVGRWWTYGGDEKHYIHETESWINLSLHSD